MNNLNENELLYAIALTMYKAYSDLQKRNQLQFYKSAYNVFKYRNKNLGDWPLQAAEAELKYIEKFNHIICSSNYLVYITCKIIQHLILLVLP